MTPELVNNKYLHQTGTERLAAFSDGVFAIAITLLVLEIKIPKHEDLIHAGGLYYYLLHSWPSYFSFVISFIAIGIYWVNHHWLFSFILRTDHVHNLLNVLFLMTIVIMPFTSAILGDFIAEPEYRSAAVTTFCIGFLFPVPLVLAVHLYATYKNRLVHPLLARKFINALTYKLLTSLTFTCVAIGLSFNYPNISLGIIIMLLLVFLLPPDVPVYENAGPIES